jgi:glycosyltransferase involved in cell wall biosynthesis
VLYPFYKKILFYCEKKALIGSDIIIAVSEEDKKRFISLYKINKNKIFIVENGFDSLFVLKNKEKLKIRKELGIGYYKKIAVFLGSATYPNVRAVEYIIKKVAPKNHKILFMLLGESAIKYKGNQSNVLKIGKINQIDKYLAVSDVGLIPVTDGSGSNLKLLNYLKCGLPVLSTNFGVRGYKKLKKYIKIVPLEKFTTGIRDISIKKIPRNLLLRYKWKNLAIRLYLYYKSAMKQRILK